MKKFLALALSFALTLPLAACGGNPGNASAPPSGSSNTQDSIQISYAHMGGLIIHGRAMGYHVQR